MFRIPLNYFFISFKFIIYFEIDITIKIFYPSVKHLKIFNISLK